MQMSTGSRVRGLGKECSRKLGVEIMEEKSTGGELCVSNSVVMVMVVVGCALGYLRLWGDS